MEEQRKSRFVFGGDRSVPERSFCSEPPAYTGADGSFSEVGTWKIGQIATTVFVAVPRKYDSFNFIP